MNRQFSGLAAVALSFCVATVARAELVTATFTLDPPNAPTNVLALTTLGGTGFSEISGTMSLTFDIDPTSGAISSIFINSANISGTDFTIPLGALGSLDGTGLGSDAGTTNSATSGGTFNAANHFLQLNAGLISGSGAIGGALGAPINLATDGPAPIVGNGTGTVTTSALGGGLFDVTVSIPFDTTVTVFTDPGLGDVDLNVLGTLVSSGQLQVSAVPEPSSIAVLGCLAVVTGVARRRIGRGTAGPVKAC
jgi:hypothetical protein